MSSPAVRTIPASGPSRPVVYHRSDYVGSFRHLIIFVVDSIVLLIIAAPFSLITPILSIAVAWCYLAVLKPSRFRSPGYWIADAKIVTLDGRSPSPYRMTLRILWMLNWSLGWPVGFLIDWLWTAVDDERQMLRDYVAETRLVRSHATPIGVGRLSYAFFTGLGLTLMYPRVRLDNRFITALPESPIFEPLTEPAMTNPR